MNSKDEPCGYEEEGRSGTRNGPGIDLVASGRSKAFGADRQTSMTHYI